MVTAVAVFDHWPTKEERMAMRLRFGWRPDFTRVKTARGPRSEILGYAAQRSTFGWLLMALRDLMRAG